MTMALTANKTRKLDWAVASYPLPGEKESGDVFVVQEHANGVLVGVIDGLGHGIEAAHAARQAVEVISKVPHESVISIIRRAHQELMQTRGVVMSLASFFFGDDTMTWISVGNVDGVVVHRDPGMGQNLTHIVQRGGVVGYQLPPLHASVLPMAAGDTIILATDGIKPEFYDELHLRESSEALAHDIGERFRKENDDALVLVIRYL